MMLTPREILFGKCLEQDYLLQGELVTDAEVRAVYDRAVTAGLGVALEVSANYFTSGHFAADEIFSVARDPEQLRAHFIRCGLAAVEMTQ